MKSIFFLVCLLCCINSKAQVKKERIACIGNSITFGARLTHPETSSYPAVLSALLNEKEYHQLRNKKLRHWWCNNAKIWDTESLEND